MSPMGGHGSLTPVKGSSIGRHGSPIPVSALITNKYRGSQQSSREVLPNLLIRHKGRQRTLGSLNSGVVNSAAPGNRLARKSLSVVTVL